MNTDTLYTFVQLAAYKNYTQTANRLYVAQSTITNRIFELEAELGKQLFIRNKRQLQLTPEGEHFLSYASRILELETMAKKEIDSINLYEHSLRIGTTNTIYDCHLASNIISYLNQHSKVKLKVTLGHSLPLLQMLLDKTIDLAFTYAPCNKPGITCTPFRTDELVLVTHCSNTIYSKGITQKELASVPYYYVDFTLQQLGSHIRDLFPKGHSFPFEIDRSANVIPYLMKGTGYCFLPESLVKEELIQGRLITIPLIDFAVTKVTSYVITTDESRQFECVHNFIKSII